MKILENWLARLAAVALFATMVLTFLDVIGRKLLGSSITGVVEVTELLMLGVIFLAMPIASLRGEHVIFDLLDPVLPASLRALQHRLSNLACVALVAGASLLVWQRADRSAEFGDTTAQLVIPMSPFHRATAVMLALTALMHLFLALRPAAAASKGAGHD